MPLDYYSSMKTILADQRIIHKLAEIYCPEILDKLNEFNLEVSVFCIQWFVCLFAKSVNRMVNTFFHIQ